MRGIHGIYAPALRVALARPRRTLLAALAFVVAVVRRWCRRSASACSRTRTSRSSASRSRRPTGASLADTDRALRFVEAELARRQEVKLLVREPRPRQPADLLQHLRPKRPTRTSARCSSSSSEYDPRHQSGAARRNCARSFARYPGARINVESIATARRSRRRSRSAIIGTGPRQAAAARERGREAIIAAMPGTRDVENPVRLLRTDLDLRIDTDKAALFGVPRRSRSTARCGWPSPGSTVGKFREPDGESTTSRCACRSPAGRRSRRSIHRSRLGDGRVGAAAAAHRPAVLDGAQQHQAPRPRARSHRDRLSTTTGRRRRQVTQDVLARSKRSTCRPATRSVAGGELEAQQESFGGLGTAVLVAVFGILAVLVLEFGSFRSMLIVRASCRSASPAARRAARDRLQPLLHGDDRLRRADRHRDQELDPAGGFHQPAARAGHGAGRGDRAGRRNPLPADPADVAHGDRRPAAARAAGLGTLLAAGDRDHRRTDVVDAARRGS